MTYPNVNPTGTVIITLIIVVMMTLVGCGDSNIFEGFGDKDSEAAQTEAALIAMDNGDYQAAINILSMLVQNHPGDALLLQYLSSAYSGAAGLDTLDILQVMDALDEAGASGNIDMIGLVLGDANGLLNASEVAAKLENINHAIATMNLIQNPNDDQTIQLGVLSMTHLSLTMADLIMTDLDRDEVILTEDGIDEIYGDNPADFSFAAAETLTSLGQDLANISTATEAIESISDETNDLVQDFTDFQNAFDEGGDGQVTQSDLEAYINNL